MNWMARALLAAILLYILLPTSDISNVLELDIQGNPRANSHMVRT